MSALYLIGPRGAGKSSAGQRAAALLRVPFVDTDRRVEQHLGLAVPQIFALRGEATFRAAERQILLQLLANDDDAIVATGGGCVLDADVRQELQRRPGVLWLTAPLAALQRRVRGSGRPSLTGGDPARELEQILSQRERLYLACSGGVQLDTSSLSPQATADAVARHFMQLNQTNRGEG